MSHEVVKEWVEVFTDERIHRRLSQRALAEIAGVTSSHISQWESGKFRPNVDSCVRWGRALGFEVRLVRVAQQ